MSTVLVTGGAGFIGSHLVERLLEEGHAVRVLDDLSSGRRANVPAGVELFEGCITDAALVRRAAAGADRAVHLAAQVSVPQSVEEPERSYAVNVTGTLNLLEAARAEGMRAVVFAASSAAYGDHESLPLGEDLVPRPLSPYASGKVAGEHLMRVWSECYGLHTTSLRFFNVFGPRQVDDSPYTGVIAIFARALLDGRQPTLFGDGGQTRDFTFVANVVDGILLALRAEHAPGQVLNLGAGDRVSLLELHAAMARALGMPAEPSFGPPRAGDVLHSQADPALVREVLGWGAGVPWEVGLEKTLDWYRADSSNDR
jgi:UDP-glucose 4-epimerase